MHLRPRSFFPFSVLVLAAASCADDAPATWTLSDAKASISPDSHVLVDVVYVNEGDSAWGGSRCVVIEWQKGTILTREQARARQPAGGANQVVETQRWCNGGNKALKERDRDLFAVVSTHTRDELLGSTIVVAGEAFKDKADDDRVTMPSP